MPTDMRVVVLGTVATALMVLGAGFGWLGVSIAYTAIDPDAYRDSTPLTYLVFGGGFIAIAVTLLVAGVGVFLMLLEYHMPRWPGALVALFGLLPYPVFLGAPAFLINLVLLAVAAVLLASRRATRPGVTS